jgi:uncharacterized protein (DUF2141 family)
MLRLPTLAVTLILAASPPSLALIASLARAADLTITIKDVRNDTGMVMLALYDGEETFMNTAKAKAMDKAPAAAGEVTFVFRDLPAGQYAATAFHDENGNSKLDKNWVGIPKEGLGFTNDAQGTMGPPKYAQAAFAFDGKTNTAVSFFMNY